MSAPLLLKAAAKSAAFFFRLRKPSRIITYNRLIALSSQKATSKGSKICHITCSGWSLNSSQSYISSSDYVIGCNFAALSDLSFDAYFIERGGWTVESISLSQLRLVVNVIAKQTDLIIFKNTWDPHNSPGFCRTHLSEFVRFLIDIPLSCYSKEDVYKNVNRALSNKAFYLLQLKSSLLAMICLAKQTGFTTIVIHGLDFGGEYFFHSHDYKGSTKYLPPSDSSPCSYKKSERSVIHSTAQELQSRAHFSPSTQSIISAANSILLKDGISLYAATDISPLSAILPVYYS